MEEHDSRRPQPALQSPRSMSTAASRVTSIPLRSEPADAGRIRGPGRRWRSWREFPKSKLIRIGIGACSASSGRAFKPGRAPHCYRIVDKGLLMCGKLQ